MKRRMNTYLDVSMYYRAHAQRQYMLAHVEVCWRVRSLAGKERKKVDRAKISRSPCVALTFSPSAQHLFELPIHSSSYSSLSCFTSPNCAVTDMRLFILPQLSLWRQKVSCTRGQRRYRADAIARWLWIIRYVRPQYGQQSLLMKLSQFVLEKSHDPRTNMHHHLTKPLYNFQNWDALVELKN